MGIYVGGQYIPDFKVSDIMAGAPSPTYGDDGRVMSEGNWSYGLNPSAISSYFPGWDSLNSNNWMFQGDQSGNLTSLMLKSGDKEGTIIPFSKQGESYVPGQPTGTVPWDTNDGGWGDALKAYGSLLAAGTMYGGMPGPEAGTAAAGGTAGGTAAGTAAGTTAAGTAAGAGAMNLGSAASWLGSNANWLMPALGALSGVAGSGPSTQTTQTQLPPWLQQLGPDFTNKAREVAGMQYPGEEPFNADQQAAFSAIRNRAGNDPTQQAAEGLLGQTLRGDFLTGNPYVEDMVRQSQDDIQGRFGSTLLGSGSFGNANVAKQGFQAVADAGNQLRFGNYNAERNRQQGALGMAPSISDMGYSGARNLLGIGGLQQDFGQRQRTAPFDFGMKQLGALGSPFGFNQGTTQTTTTPGASKWEGLLGGGLSGLALARMFGGK